MNSKVSCKSQNDGVMPSESAPRKSIRQSGTMQALGEHCASPQKGSKRRSLLGDLYHGVMQSVCHFKLKETDCPIELSERGSLSSSSGDVQAFSDDCATPKKGSKRSSLCVTLYRNLMPSVKKTDETGAQRGIITQQGTLLDLDDHCLSSNAAVKLSSGKFRKTTLALVAATVLLVVLYTETLIQFSAMTENPAQPISASITPAAVKAAELKASHHEDKWLPFINDTLAEPFDDREDTIRDIVDDADPAMIQRFNLFLRAYAPDDDASAAPRIPENAEPRDQDRKTKDIKVLMQSSNSNQYHVLTEIIKKSEPKLQAHVHQYVRSVAPSKRRLIEEEMNDQMKKVEQSAGPESFLIFSQEEWVTIEMEMQEVKDECSELYKIAETIEGEAKKNLREVVDAFMHIQKIVFVNEEEYGTGPRSPKIHYFHYYQNHFEKFQKKIDEEIDVQKKRALLFKYKSKLKIEWELFIESRVRTFLALALGHNELQQTIGDNLKAIQEHPGFPQEAKTKLEAIFRQQFMSIGAKCRFMKFLTIGDASGELDDGRVEI